MNHDIRVALFVARWAHGTELVVKFDRLDVLKAKNFPRVSHNDMQTLSRFISEPKTVAVRYRFHLSLSFLLSLTHGPDCWMSFQVKLRCPRAYRVD